MASHVEGEEVENLNHVAFLVLRVNLLKGKRTGILDKANRVQGFNAYWLHEHWLVTIQKQKKERKRESMREKGRREKVQQKEEEEGKHNRKRRRGKAQERGREREPFMSSWSAITSSSKLLAATS